jgi:hypothetical protein
MTLDTDQPTSSGKVWTLPTPKPLPTTKGKEPIGKKLTTPANTWPIIQPYSIQKTQANPTHDANENEEAILIRQLELEDARKLLTLRAKQTTTTK